MKNLKGRRRKLMSILLSLCMVLAMLPITVFASAPATQTADFTADDNGAAAIALLNQFKTGSADSNWDSSSKTLTLKGIDFTTIATTAVKLPAGSTVVLTDGTVNTVKSGDATVNKSGSKTEVFIIALDAVGDLTVKGGTAGTGTLSVTSGYHNNSGNADTYSAAIRVDGDFTVTGGHVTAQGGKASAVSTNDVTAFAFSEGVIMDSKTNNKFLQIRGGSLTAIGGESYRTDQEGVTKKHFSRGVDMYRGSVSVTGNGKLTAQIVPAMNDSGLTTGIDIYIGDLLVSNEGEAIAAGHTGVEISGGGIRVSGGRLTATKTIAGENDYDWAIDVSRNYYSNNTDLAGNIEVSGGTLETVNEGIYMDQYSINTDAQRLFTVTGGTVKIAGDLCGPNEINISGGTVQTGYIYADELTLSNAALTVREPVYRYERTDGTYELYAAPALWLKKLTVNSGTLDAAWDWGQYTPEILPVDTEDGLPQPLVRMDGETYVATFNGGTAVFDTGCAGNLAMMMGRIVLGDGMEETGANEYQYQLSSDTPVRFAAAQDDYAIRNIEITGATLSYNIGDTPVATAGQSDGNAPHYEIEFESWAEYEERDGGLEAKFKYWFSDGHTIPLGGPLTEFDEGMTYSYSIKLKAINGRTFPSDVALSVNGITVNIENINISPDGTEIWATGITSFVPTQLIERTPIEVIEISDATVTFNAGDTPVFTGKTPDSALYYIDHEGWASDDGGITSSDFWNSRYGDFEGSWGKLITSFDANTQYSYNIYLKLTEEAEEAGYYFDKNVTKLSINGQVMSLDPDSVDISEGSDDVAWFWDVLTMTPTSTAQDIANVDVTVTAPVARSFPAQSATTDNANVSVGQIEWDGFDNNLFFKAGKVYTAVVTLNAADGYRFTSETAFKINGNNATIVTQGAEQVKISYTFPETPEFHFHSYGEDWKSDADNHWHECSCGDKTDIAAHTFTWVTDKEANVTEKGSKHEECTVCGYKKAAVEIPATGIEITSDYKITEGANGSWKQNSDGTLTFRANGDFSKFTGVKVDGALIDAGKYTAVSGSTVVTLKADYLNTLSVGTHTLTVVYNDGECSTNFEIKAAQSVGGGNNSDNSNGGSTTQNAGATSPKTGDNSNIALWIALLSAGVVSLTVTAVYGKRKKRVK